jgi:hypothetical protein
MVVNFRTCRISQGTRMIGILVFIYDAKLFLFIYNLTMTTAIYSFA